MNIQHGLKRIRKDPRDFSHHRTFGALVPTDLPAEYSCDSGLPFVDQNAIGMPFGCTGVTGTGMCQDQDVLTYQPYWTYRKTCQMEGHDTTSGCDIRTSLKSLLVYGALESGESDDGQALGHRRGSYFNVERVEGLDWFDSIRSALYINRAERRSVSIGTPWFPEFEATNATGIVSEVITGDPSSLNWHNWRIFGWTTINGEMYLMADSHQGTLIGDKGKLYFSRLMINRLLAIRGTGAFTVRRYLPTDIKTVQISILQTVIFYLQRIRNLLNL